jgi:proline iminopeptidase
MYLDVDGHGHKIYYEVHGLPQGKPAVVLHGGPGGGLQRSLLQLFDLKKWRVLMFDQRGCGRSKPFLSLERNTTWDLVADIEALRSVLDVEQWTVFGGSWGSTLALAYASKHMERVAALVLRGIYLGAPSENEWLYSEGGASELKPKEWAKFVRASGSGSPSATRKSLIPTYRRLLANRRTRKAAAAAWSNWETSISTLKPQKDLATPREKEALAVLENHYFSHGCWLRPGYLLRAAKRIPQSVPTIIVQGTYDLVCPPVSAVALAKAVRHSELHMTHAGHASLEPETAAALKKALHSLE